MDKENLKNCVHLIKRTNIKGFKKETLLAMLPVIDEEIAENRGYLASASKNYDEATKATPKGENIPEFYEDFIEPYEDSIEFLENKYMIIKNRLAEIEAEEKKDRKDTEEIAKIKFPITDMTLNGFRIREDSPDDLTLFQNGKAILKISLPEMATQWNTKLP